MTIKPISHLLNFSIINIDKPTGPTSFKVSQFVKDKLNLSKTSHLGTLDPAVTGVLPVALGRACKLNETLMHRDKIYVGIMSLHKNPTDKELNDVIKSFIGKITQLPPVRSSVKRAERQREVKTFEIIERNEKDVLFQTQVQAGTYIRKLCHDIGEKIGGAHMLELRRIQAGIFDESTIINLYDFEKVVDEYKKGNEEPLRKIIQPAEEIIKKILPIIQASSSSVKQLLTGKPIRKEDIKSIPEQSPFAIFKDNQFIGIYKLTDEKDFIARPEFVFN